jgi:hypothetical protein
MAEYRLSLYGWEIEASAHRITRSELEKIVVFMKTSEITNLTNASTEIESILDGYTTNNTNFWSVSRPIAIPGHTHLTLNEKVGIEIFSINLEDIQLFQDLNIPDAYSAIPKRPVGSEAILFSAIENKGTVCAYHFESSTVPTLRDFKYSVNYIHTPKAKFRIIDRIQFKGTELLPNFDETETVEKSSLLEIYQ